PKTTKSQQGAPAPPTPDTSLVETPAAQRSTTPATPKVAPTPVTKPAAPAPAPAVPSSGESKVNGRTCAIPGCGKPVVSKKSRYCSPECHQAAQTAKRLAASMTPTQKNEAEAQRYCKMLVDHVSKKNGRYLIDEQGEYSVLLDEHRIPLNGDSDNHLFNRL